MKSFLSCGIAAAMSQRSLYSLKQCDILVKDGESPHKAAPMRWRGLTGPRDAG